jgi:hypothetical protein
VGSTRAARFRVILHLFLPRRLGAFFDLSTMTTSERSEVTCDESLACMLRRKIATMVPGRVCYFARRIST